MEGAAEAVEDFQAAGALEGGVRWGGVVDGPGAAALMRMGRSVVFYELPACLFVFCELQ